MLRRITMHPLAVPAAATPSLALGLWLLHVAGAPRSALLQQAVAIAAGTVIFAAARGWRFSSARGISWAALALALSLWLPLAIGSDIGPERWIAFGNVRLYLAPVVLPLLVFRLGGRARVSLVTSAAVVTAAVALALQPDAAQLTAYALAMLTSIVASRAHLGSRVVLVAVLLACAIVAWRAPDPLAPVPYVEGVFRVAADASVIAFVAALASAALPVFAFAWLALAAHSSGALAVAVYYASLFALAPLQITPVPLLGFGAGPILGYFLVAGAVCDRRSRSGAGT